MTPATRSSLADEMRCAAQALEALMAGGRAIWDPGTAALSEPDESGTDLAEQADEADGPGEAEEDDAEGAA